MRLRSIDDGAIAKASGRHGRHAPQLAATQDADGRPRRQHFAAAHFPPHAGALSNVCCWHIRQRGPATASSDGALATAPVWRALQRSTEAMILASPRPTMDAAKMAALTAPALPIARVPTGMPAGIWTMERRLSMPFNAALSTGT